MSYESSRETLMELLRQNCANRLSFKFMVKLHEKKIAETRMLLDEANALVDANLNEIERIANAIDKLDSGEGEK